MAVCLSQYPLPPLKSNSLAARAERSSSNEHCVNKLAWARTMRPNQAVIMLLSGLLTALSDHKSRTTLFQRHAALLVATNAVCTVSGFDFAVKNSTDIAE